LDNPSPDAALKILLIDEDPIRRAILEAGLREAGFANVVYVETTTGLLDQVYRIDPDVILIDLENPSRDELEQMFQVSRIVRRPIAMFVDQSDRSTTEAAVDAGVSAYIVGGLQKERIKGILELCISRFNAVARLQDELDRAKDALEARKTIDRAKGILMQLKGLSEEQAYALLRKTAMNEKRKIADVAQAVITATELLK
jgi:two-component system, response regulator / RNA-binding antiterminator